MTTVEAAHLDRTSAALVRALADNAPPEIKVTAFLNLIMAAIALERADASRPATPEGGRKDATPYVERIMRGHDELVAAKKRIAELERELREARDEVNDDAVVKRIDAVLKPKGGDPDSSASGQRDDIAMPTQDSDAPASATPLRQARDDLNSIIPLHGYDEPDRPREKLISARNAIDTALASPPPDTVTVPAETVREVVEALGIYKSRISSVGAGSTDEFDRIKRCLVALISALRKDGGKG